MANSRIGIYINAFDPINYADLEFANAAISQTDLDKAYLLPEPRPKYQQGVKALEHRAHMVVLAVKSNPRLGTIVIKSQFVSTADVSKVIARRFYAKQVYVVVPEDRLGKLDSWKWLKFNTGPLHLVIGPDKLTPNDVKNQVKIINAILPGPIDYTVFKAPSPTKLSPKVRRELKKGMKPEELPE